MHIDWNNTIFLMIFGFFWFWASFNPTGLWNLFSFAKLEKPPGWDTSIRITGLCFGIISIIGIILSTQIYVPLLNFFE